MHSLTTKAVLFALIAVLHSNTVVKFLRTVSSRLEKNCFLEPKELLRAVVWSLYVDQQ